MNIRRTYKTPLKEAHQSESHHTSICIPVTDSLKNLDGNKSRDLRVDSFDAHSQSRADYDL